jgi:predicted ATPase/class 3 adenylate cyclase/Tfp pilus assembly protein PilF
MPAALSEKIKAAAVEIIGERREVTVLCLAIADFTAAAQVLDSEEIYLWTDEAMRLWTEVIYQYEGTVDKFTSDGLLALFGLPVTHENDPERAVRAALEMHHAAEPLRRRFKRDHGLEVQVRIGVHTGSVIAGQIGNDLHMEYTVVGDTLNLAWRLQRAAEPGTVAVSFATYQRTRPIFKYRPLPPFEAEGESDLVRAFHPLEVRVEPGQIRGLPRLQVPMVGRTHALDQLGNALTRVLQGDGSQIALITGEAGIGKSRLVAEFAQTIDQSNVRLLQGSCVTYARSKPLWLVVNLLRDVLDLSETDSARVQCVSLRACIDQLGLDGDSVFPYVFNVLGLAGEDAPIPARLSRLDNTVLQKLTHSALREVLLAEARQRPSVLVFEDLHWVDLASRNFLEYLIQSIDDAPLLLILVSRDAERDTVLKPLIAAAEKRRHPLVDIELEPLTSREGQMLIDRLIEQPGETADALKRYIVERAEGNPYYAEEIIRMLIEQGSLTAENELRQPAPEALEMVKAVPGTLSGLIMARFDRLSQDLRQVLQKVAVFGLSFPVSLVEDLNGSCPEEIAARLRALEERQFLVAAPFREREGYAFRHALVQEVVYNTLLRRDRQRLHEEIGRSIETSADWSPDELTETIAYHFVRGANPSLAVPYLIAAGENAARRCAYETAQQHFRQALTLMQEGSAHYDEQLSKAQIGLGQALKFMGEFREAAEILEDAFRNLLHQSMLVDSISLLPHLVQGLRELADIRLREGALDEAVAHLQSGLDALGDEVAQRHPQLVRVLVDRLAWVRFRQGQLEEAFALASSATLDLASGNEDDPLTLASLHNTLGGIFWQWGDLSAAAEYVQRSLEAYQRVGYTWGMSIAYTNLGVLHFAQGLWPQAVEYYQQAYTLRRENGYLPEQALSLNNLGDVHMAMGHHAQARQDLEESLAVSRRLGEDFGVALALIGLGRLAVVEGRFDDGAAHIRQALRLSEAIGEDQLVETRWLWALIQAERGDLPDGIETAEQALALAREAGLTQAEADCRRVLGDLRARAGEVVEAEALLREAIDAYLQVNAPYGRGLALLELGRVYHRSAQNEDTARGEWQAKSLAAYNAAVEQFESLGASHDLLRAQTALSQLQSEMATGMSPDQPQVGLDEARLSPRGRELPEGDRRSTPIVWLELSPPPDADAEAVFETLALILPALTTIAHEQRGRVVRRQDGLTIVFGAPVAHEDDAERAVQTAWDLLRYLEKAAHQSDVPLSFRVAVSQGQVVVGHIGSQFHKEFAVKGEPVGVAQRLAESAPVGKVWVTDAVRTATERLFNYQPAPPGTVIDVLDLSPWVLTGRREQPVPARGLPGLKGKLVGRDEPLQAMIEQAQQLGRGMGGLIWIEGEPGIGKSRLMSEFSESIGAIAPLRWMGRCLPQKTGQSSSLFTDLFNQTLGFRGGETAGQIRARVGDMTQTWPRDARMMYPYLEVLLGLKPEGLEGARLNSLEPEQLRQQVFVALRRLLKSLTAQQPVVLMLDDLHWIDPMSAELLQFLIPMVTSGPILFVCAQRRQGSDSPNDRLIRIQNLISTQTVQISLDRLSGIDSEALLEELLPGLAIPEALRDTILERSEGNPYFIEEYVRMLIEQGYVRHGQEGWLIDPEHELRDIPVPSSLETLVRSRIDALPPELKELVQCAAVVGDGFETNLLESIVKSPDVRKNLDRLESRLLVRRGAVEDYWEFSHALIETVTYNTMLKARRKKIHLEVAQALELRWSGVEAQRADELAYHYIQAGEEARALSYLLLAGEGAAARFANEEARAFFEQAILLLRTQPDVPDGLHWRVISGLGDVYRALGRFEESQAILEEGLELGDRARLSDDQRAGLHRRLGEAALKRGELEVAYAHLSQALTMLARFSDPRSHAEVARALNGLAWIHFVRGNFDQARRASESSLVYAQDAEALSELATAENLLGGIYYQQSDWTPALHHTTRAMILREQMGYTWGVASTLCNMGVLAVSAGHWSKARSFFERSLALRQEIGDIEGLAIAYNNLGTLARDQGELETAEKYFRQSLEAATSYQITFQVSNATVGLAKVLLLKGDLDGAQAGVDASMEQAQAIGADDLLAEIYRTQAEIQLSRAAWEEAMTAAHKSAALASETGNRSLEAAARRVVSYLETERGDLQAAYEALNQARKALAGVGDDMEAGRLLVQAGRILLAEGKSAQGESQLQEAYQVFLRLGASLDLKQVEEVLRRATTSASGADLPSASARPERRKPSGLE